jgi:hypothetical protein
VKKNTLEQAQLVAQTMWDSLDLNSLHGPKLEALVRKGGDVCVEEEAKASYYENFLEKFPEWNNHDTHPSILIHPDLFHNVDPLMRYQEAWSTVCYMIAVGGAIYYSMCLNIGTFKAIAVGQYAVNISRFIRNEFSDQEIVDNIFGGNGGWPSEMLLRCLKPFNPGKRDQDIVRTIHLGTDCAPAVVYQIIAGQCAAYCGWLLPKVSFHLAFCSPSFLLKFEFYGEWEDKVKYDARIHPNGDQYRFFEFEYPPSMATNESNTRDWCPDSARLDPSLGCCMLYSV